MPCLNRSNRVKSELEHETQTSIRDEIFEQQNVDEEALKEEADRMDVLMRNLIGSTEDDEDVEDKKEEANGTNKIKLIL
jgi:hypothetical protein